MQAVIIAAGQGTRLRPLTNSCPKCLLKITDDKSLLDLQLDNLSAVDITDITIVTGYRSSDITNYCVNRDINFIYNNNYGNCNQLGSFLCAKNAFKNDCLVIFSDVLFHKNVLIDLIEKDSSFVVAIEKRQNFDDQDDKISLIGDKIEKIGKERVSNESSKAEFIGLSKIKYEELQKFINIATKVDMQNSQAYFYDALQLIIDEGNNCEYIQVKTPWIEIDYKEDLELAKSEVFNRINEW